MTDIKTDFEFSRLVSSDDKPTAPKKKSKKEKRDTFKGKDYKTLLKKAEEREIRLERMAERDPEKADALKDEIKWTRALKRASGDKVKDNVELLKKGIKRKESVKHQKKKKWGQRVKEVNDKKQTKQQKRQTNLQKVKDKKIEKKIARSKKRGRVVIKN